MQSKMTTGDAKIKWYHGSIRRGGWTLGTDFHLAPHPFDDFLAAKLGRYKKFEFIMARRAEVARTQALFGVGETWSGSMEYVDPFHRTRKALATLTLTDIGTHAIARINAVERSAGIHSVEHREMLVVVPCGRLLMVRPRRILPTLESIEQPVQSYLMDRIRGEQYSSEPRNLAFSIPLPASNECEHIKPVFWFRMTLIRAMLRWMNARDFASMASNRKAFVGPRPATTPEDQRAWRVSRKRQITSEIPEQMMAEHIARVIPDQRRFMLADCMLENHGGELRLERKTYVDLVERGWTKEEVNRSISKMVVEGEAETRWDDGVVIFRLLNEMDEGCPDGVDAL
jgi:hypothetical protein